MENLNFQALQGGIDAIINKGFWFSIVLIMSIVTRDWFIMLYRSISVRVRADFKIGDTIQVEGYEGEVINLSGFRIRLRTKEGHHVIIPISILFEKAHKVRDGKTK